MTFDPEHASSSKPAIRSEFAGDPDMQEIIEMFVEEMPQRIRQLRESWVAGQFDTVKCVAHQLKGASGGYGFGVLGTAAGALERGAMALASGAAERQLEEVRRQMDELIDLCGRVTAE